VKRENLVSFRLVVKETDLFVQAESELIEQTRERVLACRGIIEAYIRRYPEFALALEPWCETGPAPEIIRHMIDAGKRAGVGPMAAVAGAVAESVGRGLLAFSKEVIVENGGDVFLRLENPFTAGIYAGGSQLSMKIGIRVNAGAQPVSVCTSSGTVGHSKSFGKADAVCAVSESCATADAAATAIANMIGSKSDMTGAVEFGKQIQGIKGIVAVMDDRVAAWGDIEVVPLKGKKG
jgi:ApbE superfamily uncharacterized protein (UPF0280 family)